VFDSLALVKISKFFFSFIWLQIIYWAKPASVVLVNSHSFISLFWFQSYFSAKATSVLAEISKFIFRSSGCIRGTGPYPA
jgi:hypothetical protein